MRLTRGQFLGILGGLFAVAGLLASYYREVASDVPADIAYLFGLLLLEGMFFRGEFWVGAFIAAYAGSLLFIFFYLLVAPLEAPLMLAAFFWPTYQWQKKRLTGWQFFFLGLGLSVLSWVVVKRPAVPFLLFPVLQLIAVQVAGKVRPRYTRFVTDLGVGLSLAQRQQQGDRGWARSGDWFDLLQTEFEKLPTRLAETWADLTSPHRHRPVQDEEQGPARALLHLQKPALMSQALTDLTRRDPSFRLDAFLKRVEGLFWKVQNAWYDQQIEPLEPVISDALYEQFRLQRIEQQAAGIRFRHSQMTIFENRVVQVNTDPNFDVIHVYLRASSADSLIDLKTGAVLAEEEHRRQFSEYWTFIRRPSAQTLARPGLLEGHCPDCSAPLEIGQATVCRVCGAFVRSGAHDWVLAKITQACEWEYLEPDQVPGWRELVQADPGLSIQQLEDRAGVLFWIFRQAERQQKVEPIARFALPALCARFAAGLGRPDPQGWSFMENVALGSVRLRGVRLGADFDRVFLLVVWSGLPVIIEPDGRINRDCQVPRLVRDVFILVRRHGQQTDTRLTLSSAHCPQCGGPLASAFTVQCSYCDTVLNEGEAGWILERVASEFDPQVQALQREAMPKAASHLGQSGRAGPSPHRQSQAAAVPPVTAPTRRPDPPGASFAPEEPRTIARAALAAGGGNGSGLLPGQESPPRTATESAEAVMTIDEGDLCGRAGDQGLACAADWQADHRTDLLFVMIQMALADGRLADEEWRLLRAVAGRLGVREARLQAMVREMQAGRVHVPDVPSPEEARRLLQAAARMVLADGVLVPAEEQALRSLAGLLGYSEADVKQILGRERQRRHREGESAGASPDPALVKERPGDQTSESVAVSRVRSIASSSEADGRVVLPPDSAFAVDESPHQPSCLDVLQMAIQVLLADGTAAPAELDLLGRMARSYGVTPTRLEAIVAAVRRGEGYLPSPRTRREAMNLLLAAARMAQADGAISPAEEQILQNLAAHLGYSRLDLKRALARARS